MLNGGSYTDLLRMMKFLGLPFITFKTYTNVENVLGRNLVKISEKTMSTALEQEITQTKGTHMTDEWGTLPEIGGMVDMGWQKRASGRT